MHTHNIYISIYLTKNKYNYYNELENKISTEKGLFLLPSEKNRS